MFNCIVFLSIFSTAAQALFISRQAVLKPFSEGKALKIISGLNNYDAQNVLDVSRAAFSGGATHVDIACSPELVRAVKAEISIPVCVSSIYPKSFVDAVEAGADMIEIGNFDAFYAKGMDFSAANVIAIAAETRALCPKTPLSVTIPHTLSLNEQMSLAIELESMGVDILQTEGKMVSKNADGFSIQELIEMAAPTLASTYAISRAVSIPVMCSSGLTDVTAPLAMSMGAKGVGIGSMVNKLADQQQMYTAVVKLVNSLGIDENRSTKTASEIPIGIGSTLKTTRQRVKFL